MNRGFKKLKNKLQQSLVIERSLDGILNKNNKNSLNLENG